MKIKAILKKFLCPVLGLFLIFSVLNTSFDTPAYAVPTRNDEPTATEQKTEQQTTSGEQRGNDEPTTTTETTTEEKSTCYDNSGGLGWLICPTTGLLANIIDNLYSGIESYLKISPLSTDNTSPIYLVWQYARDITNVVFIIFLLIIVWSQLTGVGISNYGIKKTLPRIIIAAILVNLSYLICTLAVDTSNIIGVSIKNFLTGIAETAAGSAEVTTSINFGDVFAGLVAGGTIAGIAIGLSGGLTHLLWMFVGTALAGTISIFVGFLTVAMRQAVVAILVMISPLAFVCYLLPNTEKWFDKWKSTLTSMLIFYPMFAGLFGACQLAGWAITASAGDNAFFVILGLAVRVVPLFMAAKLLKMSGTVLGSISGMLSKWTDPATRAARKWTGEHAEMHKQRYIANSYMPSASLRRYLDKRKRLRDLDTKSNIESRTSLAEAGAQKIIGTGGDTYDPGNPNQRIRTTVWTRDAKSAMNRSLSAQTAALDTQHILGNYGDFHNKTEADRALHTQGGVNFLEYNRAETAAVADSYADIDWLMGKYDAIRSLGAGNYQYDHYITGAAGALKSGGEALVLGQVISKAAANESKRRQALGYVYAKYGYPKGDARDFIVGYHVNDDGLATYAPDEFGNRELVKINDKGEIDQVNGRPELGPGEFLKYHPEVLQGYNKYELVPDGKGGVKKRYYYDVKDKDDKFVTRVFRDDGPSMKETLAGWDMPIQDPINGLYGILSGINQGDIMVEGLEGVGLGRLSTTIGRAMISSKYSEKAAFASPMYATSIGQSFVKDFVQQNIERLDNLTKTAKPSRFNQQDFAEFQQLHNLMNPKNWERMLFDEESLMARQNVNGKFLEGTRILYENGQIKRDEKGKIMTVTVPASEATKEELQNTIIVKFLNPTASRMATMMTRITQQTLDNQKPGVAEEWVGLLSDLELIRDKLGFNPEHPELRDEEFIKKYPLLKNPLAEQSGSDIVSHAHDLRRELNPNARNGRIVNGVAPVVPGGGNINPTAGNPLAAGAPASGQTYNHAHSLSELHSMIDRAAQGREDRMGADPILTDDMRAANAELQREIDDAYLAEQRAMGDLDPSDNPNLQIRINDIANLTADGEDFYAAAMGELIDAYAHSGDERLRDLIDDFENYHTSNFGATSDEFHDYLDSLLDSYNYEG